MNKKFHFIGIIILLVLLPSCTKIESPGVENSKTLILGNSPLVELVDIIACPDGGFVVGASTRENGNEDFWIIKVDAQFKIQWEQVVGSKHNEHLEKLLVDKDNKVLTCGLSDAFGQEARPKFENRNEVFYFHYFDQNGTTLWEEVYPYSDRDFSISSLIGDQRVTDLFEDSEGNFLMAGRKHHAVGSNLGSINVLIKLGKDGTFKSSYLKTWNTYPFGLWDAVFETAGSYVLFYNSNLLGAGYLEIDKTHQGGFFDYDDQFTTINSIWPDSENIPGNIARVKIMLNGNSLSYNYFFSDRVYRYTYDPNFNSVTGGYAMTGVPDITSANLSFDNHFLLVSASNIVYETDDDFKVIRSISSKFPVNVPCKLASGEFVLGSRNNNNISLTLYNSNGELETE